MACLVITSGEQEGTYFRLAQRPLLAGRDPAAEIQIVDPKVSRRHFQVRPAAAGYVLRELRSKNGVLVNGERIAGERPLADGDEILVGDTLLLFRVEDEPDRTDALKRYRRFATELREGRTVTED